MPAWLTPELAKAGGLFLALAMASAAVVALWRELKAERAARISDLQARGADVRELTGAIDKLSGVAESLDRATEIAERSIEQRSRR